ncbi:MAG: EAL domain-containing protein [Acidimicrobiales bacterium]|jgi:diguanylate cyclase (GGDEF)-like protein
MTVEAEQSTSETGHRDEVAGAVVHVLITLVHERNGDVGVAQALALADDGRSFATLGDMSSWSSLEEAVALFNAAALVTGDGAVGLHVGDALLFTADGTAFVDRLRALGTPEEAFKHISALIAHFDASCEAVALEVATDHALVEVLPRSHEWRHAHLCEMTRGLLSQVPALYGRGTALITEVECSARGGRACLYALSWDDPSADDDTAPDARASAGPVPPGDGGAQLDPVPPGHVPPLPRAVPPGDWDIGPDEPDEEGEEEQAAPEPPPSGSADRTEAELRNELNRMSVLVEGAFSTVSQLMDDDVESLLAQIAARADAVVAAHRYLLMIRVRPGTVVQLHSRGLEPDEAQALASELWREDPGDDGGSRLVVDIASPQRLYGRLAEVLPHGEVHPPSETYALGLFAEYAAAALDIFRVLTDAKRSDATARTLLSFSETLARVTNLAELVQLLADTVPAMTDCDQSTVYLWDQDLGQLVPRAWTEGMESPAASLGPILPVTGGSRRPERSEPSPIRPLPTAAERTRVGPMAPPSKPPGGVVGSESRARGPVNIRSDTTVVDRILRSREVIVLDDSTEDPVLRGLLDQSGMAASVVAPLFAGGEFLGVIAANFGPEGSIDTIRDADLHERLSGLADQAATSLQNLELLERVQHMAWHDALTGLPNRRLFEDRVEQELVRSRRVGEPVCMFFVDLDHFKTVNDTKGHAAGDDLIQQVSQRLVDTVRRQDTVARVGGDEFAILLPGLSDQLSIDQLAQRSLEAMSRPFIVLGEEVATSASIGIAMAPDHGDSYDELLSRADEAMYRAKSRGRNAFQMYSGSVVNASLGRLAVDERTLHADLIHALDHSEFFVLYQPYIDLRTGQVVGVEALVRWHHPTLGTLEPASFISMAERSEIVVALDTWVLEQACRQLRAWVDHGLDPLRLSVNLASRDLSNPSLFENIDRTLEETGIDPSLLELEITERVVLDSSGPAKENIERLRRLGVRFTIDDFGTGNSSLNRIGSFPVSTLKIDQSFVQVLGQDGDNSALVSAIISMAERLGLECVAEGVETLQQSRVLLQRGCTTAQGYFFSPPLPAGDIEKMMAGIAGSDGPGARGDATA